MSRKKTKSRRQYKYNKLKTLRKQRSIEMSCGKKKGKGGRRK